MKRTLSAMLFTGLTFSAFAQQSTYVTANSLGVIQENLVGPLPELITVAQAKSRRDHDWVVMEGSIVRQAGPQMYEFRDNSAAVMVVINSRLWQGKRDWRGDKIHIEGLLNKKRDSIEVDLKSFRFIN